MLKLLIRMFIFLPVFSLSGQQLETNFEEQFPDISKDEYHGVCLFLTTVIWTDNWTPTYTNKFISYMRRVFLVSIKRQFKTPCPGVAAFKLMINIRRNDPVLTRLYEWGKKVGKFDVVWYQGSNFAAIVKKTVLGHKCKWISTVWLDADDALLDGYFKYITEEIPRILAQTTTLEGKPWRGGVFALRSPRWLEIGLGRCIGIYKGRNIFCGYSQGQGLILDRSVWNELGQQMLHHGFHVKWLKIVREYVMHGLGDKDYVSMAGEGNYVIFDDSDEEMILLDQKEETESQIKMFDLSKNWTTSGLFVKTPFSSHFPWGRLSNMPQCTNENRYEIQREMPQYIGYIIDAWLKHKEIHITFTEACESNHYIFNRVRNQTCEEMAKDLKTP